MVDYNGEGKMLPSRHRSVSGLVQAVQLPAAQVHAQQHLLEHHGSGCAATASHGWPLKLRVHMLQADPIIASSLPDHLSVGCCFNCVQTASSVSHMYALLGYWKGFRPK